MVIGALACAGGSDLVTVDDVALENQVRAVVNVWNSQDLDQIDGIYTPDGVYEDVAFQIEGHGREEIKALLLECFTWAPDIKVEVKSVFVSGSKGFSTWVWSGTQTGEIPGLIEATGKPFSVRGASIYEFENGMIKKDSYYYDRARFLAQLGVEFEFPKFQGSE
jgi:steroid delta-isomerase-like uncharacterized protein